MSRSCLSYCAVHFLGMEKSLVALWVRWGESESDGNNKEILCHGNSDKRISYETALIKSPLSDGYTKVISLSLSLYIYIYILCTYYIYTHHNTYIYIYICTICVRMYVYFSTKFGRVWSWGAICLNNWWIMKVHSDRHYIHASWMLPTDHGYRCLWKNIPSARASAQQNSSGNSPAPDLVLLRLIIPRSPSLEECFFHRHRYIINDMTLRWSMETYFEAMFKTNDFPAIYS